MRKCLALGWLAIGGLGLVWAALPAQLQSVPVEDLYFIQMAASGTLTLQNSTLHAYQLVLEGVTPMTTYFTDRPVHQVGQVPTQVFMRKEQSGNQASFSGILTYFYLNQQQKMSVKAIEIRSYAYDPLHAQITCQIEMNDNPKHHHARVYQLRNVTLQFDAGFFRMESQS